MALNIKDEETEALVTKLTSLTGETETEAVRKAASERLERLEPAAGNRMSSGELRRWLETEVWPNVPDHLRGKGITKAEREQILGYGPDGV